MHPDQAEYWGFASRTRLIKAIDCVSGLVTGIDIDREINEVELGFLYDWIHSHDDVRHRHPFNEIMPLVVGAIEDGRLDDEEKQDILWLCSQLREDHGHVDQATTDIRTLHGVLGGLIADRLVRPAELEGLRDWLDDHDHLRTVWPYDEVDALVTSVMADKQITPQEHDALLCFFAEFIDTDGDVALAAPSILEKGSITGLCAVCPEIEFEGRTFCFTGSSRSHLRDELAAMVVARGGSRSKSVTKKVDYLVVGADGNPCWAYACYGRKVELAVRLRRQGLPLLIVHEHDFHDAVADTPLAG